jgi:secretion/DNA translocation related TadE-like protein
VTRERGAGSVAALAIVAATVALTAMVVPLYAVFAERGRVATAADAAALAAADARAGLVAGEPCALAARVAVANGAELEGCELDGYVVTVLASGGAAGLRVRVGATAGPPGSAAP